MCLSPTSPSLHTSVCHWDVVIDMEGLLQTDPNFNDTLLSTSPPEENGTTEGAEGTWHERTAEEEIVGTIYILISVVYCVPYIICMLLIATDKKMMSMPYYHVVVHMGLTDIIQLVFNGIASGIFTMMGGTEPFWINKGIGGFMNFCWVIYCFLAHVLAFNRFINIFFPLQLPLIFSMRNTRIYIAFIWIYGFCWLGAYWYPGFEVVYFEHAYSWDYNFNEMSRQGWLVELCSDTVHAVGMLIWYTLIFIKLKIKLNQISGVGNMNEQKKEIKVLIQAFLLCLMVILTIIGFFAIPYLIPNKWALFASNIIWLGCAGNNAMIYIIFNSTVKANFRKLLGCQKEGDRDGVTRGGRSTTRVRTIQSKGGTSMKDDD